ncbi:hypothetical protein ACIBHX_45000 [Nonomuraea sp. NPDC050536]|uniref:hypothetical protein n=1 Tax=Nonomuraea sp. NPDC050536 TaxID=3364366 RepID=UPI0037C9E5DF
MVVVDRSGAQPPYKGRRWAAFTLVVMAPVCAELTFGAMPLRWAWLMFPLLVPMYGAGVLLIREAVRRAGGGWPSLLLLGVAYELAEDGIALQALSSPHLYGAATWGPRVLGLNTTYWESQIGYHLVFSVIIPIVLTDLLFPAHRDRPYLRRGGLIGVGVAAVLGVAIVRLSIPPVADPGYQAPVPVLVGLVLGIAVLALLALRVLPGRTPSPAPGRTAPHPAVGGVLTALATVAFLGLLIPLRTPPAGGRGLWVLIPMVLATGLAVGLGRLIYRWSPGLTNRHRAWLVGGALVSHTLIGAAVLASTSFDRVGLIVLALLTVVLLAWASHAAPGAGERAGTAGGPRPSRR